MLRLPLTYLDGLYYDTDWQGLPQEEFADRQRELIDRRYYRGGQHTRDGVFDRITMSFVRILEHIRIDAVGHHMASCPGSALS